MNSNLSNLSNKKLNDQTKYKRTQVWQMNGQFLIVTQMKDKFLAVTQTKIKIRIGGTND